MCALKTTHRDNSLFLGEADDSKIALWTSCSWIDDNVYHLSPGEGHDGGVHQRFNIIGSETLLKGVKGKTSKL